MIYCEYRLTHSFNVIYEEKEHDPKFGFLLSAMEDPFSHTALSGLSVNFENDRLRIDNGTFASGGYIVQTFIPLYLCSPDFSGINEGHIPVPPEPDVTPLFPGMETPPGGTDDILPPPDGTEPITGIQKFTFDIKPGFSVRIAPSLDNHEFGIVKEMSVSYLDVFGAEATYSIDLTKPIPEDIKFNQRKLTAKWEDQNTVIISGFSDYENKSIDDITEAVMISTSSLTEDTDEKSFDKYLGNSLKLTVKTDGVVKFSISKEGFMVLKDEPADQYQIQLHYSADTIETLVFFEELLVIDSQGLYPIPEYTYNVIGSDKLFEPAPSLDPVSTLDEEEGYINGFNFTKIEFTDHIISKSYQDTISDHIPDKYYWLEIWTENGVPVAEITDINIVDQSNLGSYIDEHVNGYSLTYDAAEHWLYINNIGKFTVRFPAYDPVVTTPIPKELINSLHDGIIYTDYDTFEFTTETNPNNMISVIPGEKTKYTIGITTVGNETTYSFDFYPDYDIDTSVVYSIEYTSDADATVTEIYVGLVSAFQNKITSDEAIATFADGTLVIESAVEGDNTIYIDNEVNVSTTLINGGQDEEDLSSDNITDISTLWAGSDEELQALISDVNSQLAAEDSVSMTSTVDAVTTETITQTLISNWENSQSLGVQNKVLVTLQYYHDNNLIKLQVKDSYDLTRNDLILATMITEDAQTFYVTYRDFEYPRMTPYAEWNEFDSYTYASKFLPSLGNSEIPIDQTLIVPPDTGFVNPNDGLVGSPTMLKVTVPDATIVGSYSFTLNVLYEQIQYPISYSVMAEEDEVSIINGLFSSFVSIVDATKVKGSKTDIYILIASAINGENTISITDEQNVEVEVLSTGIYDPSAYNNIISGTPKAYTFTFNPPVPNAVYTFDVIKDDFNVTVSYLTGNEITQEELFAGLIEDFNTKVPSTVATIEQIDAGDGTFSLKVTAAELGVDALTVANVNAVLTNPEPGDVTTFRIDIDHVANTNSYEFMYHFVDASETPHIDVVDKIYIESDADATLEEIKTALIDLINSEPHNQYISAMDPDPESPSIIVTSNISGPNTLELYDFKTEQLDTSITATPTIISAAPEYIQENATYNLTLMNHDSGVQITATHTGTIDDTDESIITDIMNQLIDLDTDGYYNITFPDTNGVPASITDDKTQIIQEDYNMPWYSNAITSNGIIYAGTNADDNDQDKIIIYDTIDSTITELLPDTPSIDGRFGYTIHYTDNYLTVTDPLTDKGIVYVYNPEDNSLINSFDGDTYEALAWFGRTAVSVKDNVVIAERFDSGPDKLHFIEIDTGSILNSISKDDTKFGGPGLAANSNNVFACGTDVVYMYNQDGDNEQLITHPNDEPTATYGVILEANDKYVVFSDGDGEIIIYDVVGVDEIAFRKIITQIDFNDAIGSSIENYFGLNISLSNDFLFISTDTEIFVYKIEDEQYFQINQSFTKITAIDSNDLGISVNVTYDGTEADYGVHYITYEYDAGIPPGDGKTIFIESTIGGNMTFGTYNVETLLINIVDEGEDYPSPGIITPTQLKIGSLPDGAVTIPGEYTTYKLSIDEVANTSEYGFTFNYDDGSTTFTNDILFTSDEDTTVDEVKVGLINNTNIDENSTYIIADDNDSNSILLRSTVYGPNTLDINNLVMNQIGDGNATTPTIVNILTDTFVENKTYKIFLMYENGNVIIASHTYITDDNELILLNDLKDQINDQDSDGLYNISIDDDNKIMTITSNINGFEKFGVVLYSIDTDGITLINDGLSYDIDKTGDSDITLDSVKEKIAIQSTIDDYTIESYDFNVSLLNNIDDINTASTTSDDTSTDDSILTAIKDQIESNDTNGLYTLNINSEIPAHWNNTLSKTVSLTAPEPYDTDYWIQGYKLNYIHLLSSNAYLVLNQNGEIVQELTSTDYDINNIYSFNNKVYGLSASNNKLNVIEEDIDNNTIILNQYDLVLSNLTKIVVNNNGLVVLHTNDNGNYDLSILNDDYTVANTISLDINPDLDDNNKPIIDFTVINDDIYIWYTNDSTNYMYTGTITDLTVDTTIDITKLPNSLVIEYNDLLNAVADYKIYFTYSDLVELRSKNSINDIINNISVNTYKNNFISCKSNLIISSSDDMKLQVIDECNSVNDFTTDDSFVNYIQSITRSYLSDYTYSDTLLLANSNIHIINIDCEYIESIPATLYIESNTDNSIDFGYDYISNLNITVIEKGHPSKEVIPLLDPVISLELIEEGKYPVVVDPEEAEVDEGSLEEVWVNINDIIITDNDSPTATGQCSENVISVSMIVRLKYNAQFIGNYPGILAPGDGLQYWQVEITDDLPDGEYTFEVTVTTELGNTAVATDESVIIDVDGIPNVIPEPEPFTCDVSDYDVVSSTLTQYSQAVALGKMLYYDFDKMLTIYDMSITNPEITTECTQATSFLGLQLNQEVTFHFKVPADCTRMMIVPVLFGMSNEYDYQMTVNGMNIMLEHEFDHSMINNSESIDVWMKSNCAQILISGMVLLYDHKSITPTNNLRINHQHTRSKPMLDYIVIKGWEGLTTLELMDMDTLRLTTSWNIVDPNGDNVTVGIYFDDVQLIGESYEKNVTNMPIEIPKAAIMEKSSKFIKDEEDYLQVPITFRIQNVNGSLDVNKFIFIKDMQASQIQAKFTDMNKLITWENDESGYKEYIFVPVVDYIAEAQYSIWFYEHQTNDSPSAVYNNNKPATIIRHMYSYDELPAVSKFELYDGNGTLTDTILETVI